MSRAALFDLYYYSQLQLCVISATISATASAVLFKFVPWECVIVIGLSTFVLYSLDNLIDWQRDRYRYPSLESFHKPYKTFCFSLAPLAISVILVLSLGVGYQFLGLLLILGFFGLVVVSSRFLLRPKKEINESKLKLVNRLLVSFVWAIVCVLVPVWYLGKQFTPQTWMTFAFVWHLTFINSVLWGLEAFRSKALAFEWPLSETWGSHLIRALQIISVSAIILAVIDIGMGFFPFYNIVVLLAPIINLIGLTFLKHHQVPLREFNSILLLAQIFCSVLIIVVHLTI